jgi:hypothetical protein
MQPNVYQLPFDTRIAPGSQPLEYISIILHKWIPAADVRRKLRLVRSLPSRSSSRESKVVELNLRRPCAADDEGGDANTDADDLSGLSFKASLLQSMPLPLFGSLDDRLCGDLAGDRRKPLDMYPITTCVTIFPDCPAKSRHRAEACAAAHYSVGCVRAPAEGIGNRPKRRHRQLFLGLFVYHGVGGGEAAARDPSEVSRRGEMDRVALESMRPRQQLHHHGTIIITA